MKKKINLNWPKGKMVKKIIGFDANALYLWCLSQQMPCGKLYKSTEKNLVVSEVIKDVLNENPEEKLFGFVECDIEVSKEFMKDENEMAPIFVNADVENKKEIIGEPMYNLIKNNDETKLDKKERKLLGLLSAKKQLIYTPFLKWYLDHGLQITKVHSVIVAEEGRPYESFANLISDARRTGDADESMKFFGDTSKLAGNAPYGKTLTNKYKFVETMMLRDEQALYYRNEYNFKQDTEFDGFIETTLYKDKHIQDLPLQVGIAVYQLAKMKILQFYYDFLDKFVSREDFQLIQMDTDSLYIYGNY